MKLSPTLNVAASVIVIACLTLTQAMPSAFAQAQTPGSNGALTSNNNKDGAAASGALVASAAVPPASREAAPPPEKSRKKKWFVVAAIAVAAVVIGIVLSRGETEPTVTIGPPTVGP